MIKKYSVRYVKLPAREIFGMVGRCGGGYNTIWTDWTPEGRKKRECIMREYEEGLDAICGHYQKLEVSILKEGMRNPIIVTCGRPKKRSMENLPPEMRFLPSNQLLLLETTMGGSRLHVAQKHNMEIACLVNDWCERFSKAPEIKTEEDARSYYRDQPKTIMFHSELGLVEGFDTNKVGHHLGAEWSEDRIMPLRAPLWISLMNKYGYRVDKLPNIVEDVLRKVGIDQSRLG